MVVAKVRHKDPGSQITIEMEEEGHGWGMRFVVVKANESRRKGA